MTTEKADVNLKADKLRGKLNGNTMKIPKVTPQKSWPVKVSSHQAGRVTPNVF